MESTDVRIANTGILVNGGITFQGGASMASQSFADILNQWDNYQKNKSSKVSRHTKNTKHVATKPNATTKNFSDIYNEWESSHNERDAILRRANEEANEESSRKNRQPTINEIRKMKAQSELDLHEMRLEDAIQATNSFIETSYRSGLRKIMVVTGKGIHSKNGEAVLRPVIEKFCRQHSLVREVSVPKAAQGGSGALYVILKSGDSNR